MGYDCTILVHELSILIILYFLWGSIGKGTLWFPTQPIRFKSPNGSLELRCKINFPVKSPIGNDKYDEREKENEEENKKEPKEEKE